MNAEIARFLSSNPYAIHTKLNLQERVQEIFVTPRGDHDRDLLFVKVLAGECINHLRFALDHLVWQLALTQPDTPNSRTAFPLYIDAAAYTKGRKTKIGSLPPAAQTLIDGLQPYHDTKPTENLLWVLDMLCNVDKHRMLNVLGGTPHGFAFDRAGRDMRLDLTLAPIDGETNVGRVRFINPNETNMEVEIGLTIDDLTFAVEKGAQIRFVRATIKALGMEVERVVRKFDSFFTPL